MPETFPINSRTFNLAGENIDTDQIIPARFLTTTSRTGLGRFAFHDWRFDGSGSPRAHSPLSGFDAKQASVQLLKRQALGVWHADALSDVENAIGDLHFWPTTWSKDPRSRDYDMQRLGRPKRLDNREASPHRIAPVASGLVLHLLAECLVLDGTKQDAAELGILLLDDERLVDEAGRDGIHREGVEVMRGVEAGVRRGRGRCTSRSRRPPRSGKATRT